MFHWAMYRLNLQEHLEVTKKFVVTEQKKSTDKLNFTLMPVEFDDIVLVLMNGAEKYEAHGWENGVAFEKDANLASIRRHENDYKAGIIVDKDSGLHPLLHVACRAMMQYTLDKRAKNDKDSN